MVQEMVDLVVEEDVVTWEDMVENHLVEEEQVVVVVAYNDGSVQAYGYWIVKFTDKELIKVEPKQVRIHEISRESSNLCSPPLLCTPFPLLTHFRANSGIEKKRVTDGRTDGRMDGLTEGRTEGGTEGRTHPLIEL